MNKPNKLSISLLATTTTKKEDDDDALLFTVETQGMKPHLYGLDQS